MNFDGGEVLMPEDIGSISVTLFSFNWSLEMGKYDVMPWIVGLFTIFLFINSFLDEVKISIGWMIFLNKSSYRLIIEAFFAVLYLSYSVHNIIRKNISIIFGYHKRFTWVTTIKRYNGNNLKNLNKLLKLIG